MQGDSNCATSVITSNNPNVLTPKDHMTRQSVVTKNRADTNLSASSALNSTPELCIDPIEQEVTTFHQMDGNEQKSGMSNM